jgi:hypothetical protein
LKEHFYGMRELPLKVRKAGSSPLQKESSNEYKPKGTEDHGAVCPVSSVPFLAEV